MSRRSQFITWKSAGRITEQAGSGDDVVKSTGWVFNNETGDQLTLVQFVATGDAEESAYLTIFGLRSPENPTQTLAEIGCGIGRMTAALTREFGSVVACDLDAGFLERCYETVAGFGVPERLRTLHVRDGKTLDLPPNSVDVAFSYITMQHCDEADALELSAEAVRIARPGGKVVLNYRSRSAYDIVVLPLGTFVRQLFRLPKIGSWLSQQRTLTRLGWQANRLEPDEVIGPLSPLLRDIEVWRNPKSSTTGTGAEVREFAGLNTHHYWIVATPR